MTERPLATRFADLLPTRPRITVPVHAASELFDLLVPRLRRPHVWFVIGGDVITLNEMFEDAADWAASRGWTTTTPARAMLIHTPFGACRIETGLDSDTRAQMFDAVASDLPPFTRITTADVDVPLFMVGGNGAMSFRPLDASDRLMIERAPRPDRIISELRDGGFIVASAAYTQTTRAGQLTLLRREITHIADAARTAHPCEIARIDIWEAKRLRQALAGRLALRRQRRDILALPNEE